MMVSERSRALRALLIALAWWRRSPSSPAERPRTTRPSDSGASTPTADGAVDPNAEIPKGLKTVSIPKQLGNPYEEFEHSGIDEALTELGGSNRISGPTDAGASTQISIINAAVQQKPDAIIIAGNDPDAVAPALKQAARARRQGRRHGLRRRARRAQRLHQPGHDASWSGRTRSSRSPR